MGVGGWEFLCAMFCEIRGAILEDALLALLTFQLDCLFIEQEFSFEGYFMGLVYMGKFIISWYAEAV